MLMQCVLVPLLPWQIGTGLYVHLTQAETISSFSGTNVELALWESVLAEGSLLRSIMLGVSFMTYKKPCAGEYHRKTEILSKWRDLVCKDKNGGRYSEKKQRRAAVGLQDLQSMTPRLTVYQFSSSAPMGWNEWCLHEFSLSLKVNPLKKNLSWVGFCSFSQGNW